MAFHSSAAPRLAPDSSLRALVPSLVACLLLGLLYLQASGGGILGGGTPLGHALGLVGTGLMLAAELLYSARKRINRLNRTGSLRGWLASHIVMGLVGPFLVLLHTGMKFHGLAGLAMALTGVVAASGFLGRYLYAAIPHTLAGTEATREELQAESDRLTDEIARLARENAVQAQCIAAARPVSSSPRSAYLAVLGRGYYQWRDRRRLHRELAKLKSVERGKLNELEWLLLRRRGLEFQVEALHAARTLLRGWRLLHFPLAITLFAAIAIHIAATLYFRAGLFR